MESYDGSQRPNTAGWYKPTGEGPTPCNTASERSSSPTMWGRASPTQTLLVGTQTPPCWPHPSLQHFQRWSWSLPAWPLLPPTPSRATKTHLPITARTKLSSTQERCLLSSGCEVLEQTSSASSLVTLSIYLQKTVGPSMVRNRPCSTCVTFVPIHWQFSQYCYPRLFIFTLTPNPRPAYVVITGPRGHSHH